MPRARFYNLAPRARSRLLRIATRQFAARGLEGASLNEILAEAGVSKGAYYYYFDDKDDLLATVLEDAADAMLARLAMPDTARLSREDFWPTVQRLVFGWAASVDLAGDLFRVAVQLTPTQRRSPRFAPVLAKAQSLYRRLVEAGRRLGCVRTDLPVDVLVRLLEANDAVLDGIFLAVHPTVTPWSLQRHTRLVFDTMRRLLAVEGPAPGRRAGNAAPRARSRRPRR
ncbi:MAG TPA: TetR family transcriptional regulator [Gemmatimonadales bacterium]|nr:TetR family transcriptional regulator [Gemmatimonadales bacterium]